MARVWELDLPHAERLVLLALADHADHVGDNIYPSIGLIAWKTGYSSRQVQRIVKSLVLMEILCIVGEPEGRSTIYRMDLKAGTVKEPYLRQNVTPDKMSPLTKGHTKVRQNVTPTPDIAMSPKPSVNHHDPSAVAVTAKRAPTVVGKLMDLGVTRNQSLNAIKVNPDLSLDDVGHIAEWVQTQQPQYAIGTLVGYLKEGMLPPMPGSTGKQSVEIDWNNSSQVQAYMNGAYDR